MTLLSRAEQPFEKKYHALELKMGYSFQNSSFLELALTHPSFNEKEQNQSNNQRLEFLGDSVLGVILASQLHAIYPEEDEGSLSSKKALLAKGSTLVELALKLEIQDYLKVSPSERRNKGHRRASALEDALEAMIGAIYLDGGMTAAKNTVLNWYGNLETFLSLKLAKFNPKGQLQEMIQADLPKDKITYHLIEQNGPPHKKSFLVEVRISGEPKGQGYGKSKKQAEETAAFQALNKLKSENSSALSSSHQ